MKSANKSRSVAKRSKFLILFGFIFFINPVPLGFDFIPDVFGCILLYFGLTQLAYFDGQIERAQKCTLYLMAVEAVKLLSMDMIFSTEIGSNRMLAVTAFAIVEGILYVMIFKSLFGGISYFSMRNNFNTAFSKCDGCAFITYLAFFVRIGATLVPELMAIIELEKEVVVDFDDYESILRIMDAKPMLVILLSLLALVTSIAWYISIRGLIVALFKEGGDSMDQRYAAEYTSHTELTTTKRLRSASFVLYGGLIFALDIVFDGTRIIPASVMFLVLAIGVFFLKDFEKFKMTRIFAIPAFGLFLLAERFKAIYVPYGAIRIYETDLWIVGANAIIAFFAVLAGLLFVRNFLKELNRMSVNLGGSDISVKNAYISYCVMLVLWNAGYVVPYFYASFSAMRFIAAVVFIWQTSKIILQINAEKEERASLYGE